MAILSLSIRKYFISYLNRKDFCICNLVSIDVKCNHLFIFVFSLLFRCLLFLWKQNQEGIKEKKLWGWFLSWNSRKTLWKPLPIVFFENLPVLLIILTCLTQTQIKTSHKYIMGVLCAILFCKCRYRTNTFSDIVSHLISSVSWLCSKCTNRRSCQGLVSTVGNEGYHGEHDGDYAGGIWLVISQYPCVPLEILLKSGFPLQG